MENNFRITTTNITVSSPIRKTTNKKTNIISTSTYEREFGKVISYKNKKEYEQYRRIKSNMPNSSR